MVPLIFAIGIICGAVGGLLMKVGAGHLGTVHFGSLHLVLTFAFKMFTDLYVLGGMGLYFLSAVIWLYLLTKLDISYVQPILALTYIVTPVLAILFLGESVPRMRWIGILIIVIGVYVVARTSTKA